MEPVSDFGNVEEAFIPLNDVRLRSPSISNRHRLRTLAFQVFIIPRFVNTGVLRKSH